MINPVIEHKRGDTFLFSCTRADTDLTDWTIASQVRDISLNLIATCDVTITDAAEGKFTVQVDDTTAWPIDLLLWDIQYTDNAGIIQSTETVRVKVKQDVTY